MRNVIVHRASLADRRLVEACPWLNLQINDPVTVPHKSLDMAGRAVCACVLTLTHRLGKRYNVDTHGLIERAPKKNKESQGNSKTSKTPTDTGGESVH
jgi:hypothetical protein